MLCSYFSDNCYEILLFYISEKAQANPWKLWKFYIIFFFILQLDVPQISLQKLQTEEDKSLLFKVTIKSTPAPLYAQWKVKTTHDGDFEVLDINAEKYKGTLFSLPQPVLVVRQKECLETNVFQIEVYNFIGSSTKIIPSKNEQLLYPLNRYHLRYQEVYLKK